MSLKYLSLTEQQTQCDQKYFEVELSGIYGHSSYLFKSKFQTAIDYKIMFAYIWKHILLILLITIA